MVGPVEQAYSMQPLAYSLILVVYTLDFFRITFGLPRILLLVPEALAALGFVLILRQLSKNGRLSVGPGYVLGFAIGILVLVSGLFIAEATTGPLVAGLRNYGKYFIFFLLPIACLPREEQLKPQLMLLLSIGLLQLPVTVAQRFYFYANLSGDAARGTAGTSAFNAIMLVSITAVVVAAYCKRKISRNQTLVLCAALLIPPSIADVKTAFFLIPAALVALLTLGAFVAIYDVTKQATRAPDSAQNHTSLLDLVTSPERLIHYVAPQTSGIETERYGRIDGLLAPILELKDKPMLFLTGLGLGALAQSPIDAISSDKHLEIRKSGRSKSTYSQIFWETGLLGTLLFLTGFALLWRDARLLRFESSYFGALGLGMTAIIPIILLAFVWRNILGNNTVMCLFAYFAGLVVAKAAQVREVKGVGDTNSAILPKLDTAQPTNQIPSILHEPKAN